MQFRFFDEYCAYGSCKEEPKPKFKIWDEVDVIHDHMVTGLKKGTRFIVKRIQKNRNTENPVSYSYTDYIYNQVRKPIVNPLFVIPEVYVKLVEHHKGKVLIMVDEKDNNKIIARDLVTGKKAEAKRNPNDEWDFEKGAKLAFERLYPEKKIVFRSEPIQSVKQGEKVNIDISKKKPWTGKVICIASDYFIFFEKGRVYPVIDGVLYCELGRWNDIGGLFESAKDVNDRIFPCATFVEYKGEA